MPIQIRNCPIRPSISLLLLLGLCLLLLLLLLRRHTKPSAVHVDDVESLWLHTKVGLLTKQRIMRGWVRVKVVSPQCVWLLGRAEDVCFGRVAGWRGRIVAWEG